MTKKLNPNRYPRTAAKSARKDSKSQLANLEGVLALNPQPENDEEGGNFALYVTEIPSSGLVFGKVGMVDTPENLGARMSGLKSAGSLYYPIIFAAFEVTPKPKLGPRSAETAVRNILTNRGLFSSGEIFLAPGGSIRQLLVEVESAMRDLDLEFLPIDIRAMAEDFDTKNRDVQDRLNRKRTAEATCPYEVWRGKQNDGVASNGGTYDPFREDTLRDLAALGFILADVAVGRHLFAVDWRFSLCFGFVGSKSLAKLGDPSLCGRRCGGEFTMKACQSVRSFGVRVRIFRWPISRMIFSIRVREVPNAST